MPEAAPVRSPGAAPLPVPLWVTAGLVGGVASVAPRILLDLCVSVFATSTATTFPRAVEGPLVTTFGFVVGALAGLAVARGARYYAPGYLVSAAFVTFFAVQNWPAARALLEATFSPRPGIGLIVLPAFALVVLWVAAVFAAASATFIFLLAWGSALALHRSRVVGPLLAGLLGLGFLNAAYVALTLTPPATVEAKNKDQAWPPCSEFALEKIAKGVPGVRGARQSFDVAAHQVAYYTTRVYVAPAAGASPEGVLAAVDQAMKGHYCNDDRLHAAFTGKAALARPVVIPVTAHVVRRPSSDPALVEKEVLAWLRKGFDELPHRDSAPLSIAFELPRLVDDAIVSVELRRSTPVTPPSPGEAALLAGTGVELLIIGSGLPEGTYPAAGELRVEMEEAKSL
jgi:hypothetical protein